MKKLISLALALVMILSLATVAFAAEAGTSENPTTEKTYEDMSTVTLTKEYKLTNAGTTSPAETFVFEDLKFEGVKDAGVEFDADNVPEPTIGSATFVAGAAGDATNGTQTITITLPTYEAVGIYTYTFTEKDNGIAGVTYRDSAIKLVVTVIQDDDGLVRVAGVHTENENGEKSGTFENVYSAGSLSVQKIVAGELADRKKEFAVTVKFTAPQGDTVKEAITYTEDGESYSIATTDWTDGEAAVTINLKHEETITFNNIPYGVTYTVTESDYTSGGYNAPSYDEKQNGTIDSASVSTTIINSKPGNVDTGIVLDSMPYIILLTLAAAGMFVLLTKKRAREF